MKTYLKILIVLSLFCSLQAFADTQAFTRYLQKGDKGNDVQLLQWILNSNSDTQVSSSGAGSSGNETTSYGENTKQAVIKYQKKNNLGTQYGLFTIFSGALDQKTRDALNNEANQAFSSTSTNCKTDVSTPGQSKLSVFNMLFNPLSFNPLSALTNIQQRISGADKILSPTSGASIQDRWNALNDMYRINTSSKSEEPFIKTIVVSQNSGPLGMPIPIPLMSDGMKITIYGCNFSTSTQNTIHMTFNDEKATSTDGTKIDLTLKSSLQSMFDGQIQSILSQMKDPVTQEIEKQVREKVLNNMKSSLKLPLSSSSSTSTNNNSSSGAASGVSGLSGGGIGDMGGSGMGGGSTSGSNNSDTSSNGNSSNLQMPGLPLTITVETKKGVSNPYQFYLGLQ